MRLLVISLLIFLSNSVRSQTISNLKTNKKGNDTRINFTLSDTILKKDFNIEIVAKVRADSINDITINTGKDFSYNVFYTPGLKRRYFISTNTGIRATPYGFKIGFLYNPGFYLGFRYGTGEVYNSESDLETVKTSLFSITGGLIKPLIITKKQNYLALQFGAGYGQWWLYRREGWTKSGYEIEGGFILSYRKLLLTLTTNMLNGYKTYATWDFCVGIGYKL